MFKFLITSIILATASYAIDCNDEFVLDSTRTYMKDGLIVYSSDYNARIYNISTSKCIVSFVGSRIDYPIFERIVTLNTRQELQEVTWELLPGRVAIDYLKQNGHLDDFGTDEVCDTKSKTYEMSTIGNVNCSLIQKLQEEHVSDRFIGLVVFLTILKIILTFLIIALLPIIWLVVELFRAAEVPLQDQEPRQIVESRSSVRRRKKKEIPQ